MEPSEQSASTGDAMASHDPSSISPSAYTLLLMKRHTAIPYVRQAADLVENKLRQAGSAGPNPAPPNATDHDAPGARLADIPQFSTDPAGYAIFLLHFEDRYWSIDQLMADLPITNYLELSSGFSFRGLDLSRHKPVYYIDTDLPGLIAVKQTLVDTLIANEHSPGNSTAATVPGTTSNSTAAASSNPTPNVAPAATPPQGHYELLPLDVLDSAAFAATVARFPPGPLVILNEGLLVYLDTTQKEQLCTNIRNALAARGGYWITADIYIRDPADKNPEANKNQTANQAADNSQAANAIQAAENNPAATQWQAWKTQFQIEQKKFADFDEARNFFTRMGFKIDKEATPDYPRLTSLPFIRNITGPQFLENLRKRDRLRLRTTWRLTLQQ